jgi:hypothetical protein
LPDLARRQAVLVLHADGALACCGFSFAARTLVTRWALPVELPKAPMTRARAQRLPPLPSASDILCLAHFVGCMHLPPHYYHTSAH